MIPASNRIAGGALAQIAQRTGPYDSKTDQTDQTDQRIETADEFGALPDSELTCRPPELTSETMERPGSRHPSSKRWAP
jgi:hypothetical protein